MTNGKTVLESVIPAVSKSNGGYYGKDGLLYCGKCHTPKEAFFANNLVLMGKNRHPVIAGVVRWSESNRKSLFVSKSTANLSDG